jgi:hypothetical protein
MPESSYVTRLRQSGGPSHDLLVLLDQHRVLTTDQCARASGAPERTVRHRLDRLRTAGLVGSVRPGREAGSAPAHWWLRPAGARLVAGTAVAEGQRAPSGMHMAHAAAIAEVWLALREHGPAAGLRLDGWWTDRAGWQEWTGGYTTGGGRRRLTPDAVARLQLAGADGGPVAVFIEVDLATMTQVLLRQKVARYAAYAADRAWEGRWPNCPPLLLLTTTPSRAATFVRAAGKLLGQQRRPRYGAVSVDEVIGAAETLVVAACGLVRDPAAAVGGLCWMPTDEAAGETTLAELLADRAAAAAAADAAQADLDAQADRVDQVAALDAIVRSAELDEQLGDRRAGDALRHLAEPGAAELLDAEPDLAGAVLAWWSDPDTDPAQVRAALARRHRQLWAGQARAVLAARARIEAGSPDLAVLTAALTDGRLLPDWRLQTLHTAPGRSRRQLQAAALGDYPARRDAAVTARLDALPWLTRRRTDPAELAAAYDDQHLLICDTCAILTPLGDPGHQVGYAGDECRHCGAGHRVEYARRGQIPTLTDRLDQLRRQLADQARRRAPGAVS